MDANKSAPRSDELQQGAQQDLINVYNITKAAQRHRLLIALSHLGAVNTLYARERLNILHPAGRIMELRKQGHKIQTDRVSIPDQLGRRHVRVARYVLLDLAEVAK